MSNKESVNTCLNNIVNLKQQIKEFHNEMIQNSYTSIDYMKIIDDIELEIIKNINKINNI